MMWTDEVEAMLSRWGERAQYYKILYEQSAHDYAKKEKRFGIPVIVLGYLATSSLIFEYDYQKAISFGLSLLTNILISIAKFLDYGKKKMSFIQSAQAYEDLEMDIQEQLSRDREDRLNANDFIGTIKTTMKELKRCPNIPDHIFQKYIKDIDRHLTKLGISIHENSQVYKIPSYYKRKKKGNVERKKKSNLKRSKSSPVTLNDNDVKVNLPNSTEIFMETLNNRRYSIPSLSSNSDTKIDIKKNSFSPIKAFKRGQSHATLFEKKMQKMIGSRFNAYKQSFI